jgi:excisionase family DNA binding protein
MDTIPAIEPLTTVLRAARALGVSRHLLFRAGERGELQAYHCGGWARCRLSEVQQWVENTRRQPAQR